MFGALGIHGRCRHRSSLLEDRNRPPGILMSNERRWKADAAAIDADAEAELSRGGSKGAMVARDKHPKQRALVASRCTAIEAREVQNVSKRGAPKTY